MQEKLLRNYYGASFQSLCMFFLSNVLTYANSVIQGYYLTSIVNFLQTLQNKLYVQFSCANARLLTHFQGYRFYVY